MKMQNSKLFFLPVLLGLLCSGLWAQRSNTLSEDRIYVQSEQQATSVKFDSSDDIQINKTQIPGNLKTIQDIKPPEIEYHTSRSKLEYLNKAISYTSKSSPEELNPGLEEPMNKLDSKNPGEMATEEAGSYTVNNFSNSPVPDGSGILLTYSAPGDVPADAAITGIEYSIRIIPDEAHSTFYCADYEVYIKPAPTSYDWLCVYDNLGGINDEDYDDDDDNDADIWLSWRSTDEFNGEPVQSLVIYIADNISVSGYEGYGKVSYAHIKVYWVTPPETPTLISPANGAECIPTSTIFLDWTDVPGAVAYAIQIDDNPDFSSPDQGVKYESEATMHGPAPPNTTYYWRVRAGNEAGLSSYSPARSFTTAPPLPAEPDLISPDDGATCLPTAFTFDWSAASGAARYNLYVFDDESGGGPPVIELLAISDTYVDVSGLEPNTTYTWMIGAESECGVTNHTAIHSFSTAATPGTPSLSSPADFASCQPTSISFSWGSASGAVSYQLMVDNNGDFSSPYYNEDDLISTSQIVSGLSVGETYYWRVRAKSTCGNYGSWSLDNVFAIYHAAPGEATPSSPTDAATCQALSPTITWSSGSGASTYAVQVDDNSDFSSPVLDEDGIAGTSQALSSLSEGTTYHWRVKSVNSCADESDWSSTMSFTTIISSIGIPDLIGPANDADCQPLSPPFSWESVTNAVEYKLQVDDNSDFSSPIYTETCEGNSHNSSELDVSTTFYWRVSANGDCSVTGEWSESRNFTTGTAGLDTPSLTSPADLSTDQSLSLTLAWSAISDATGYRVQLDDNHDFSSPVYDEDKTGTSLSVSGLEEGTTYYWQVRANGECSSSAWSEMWQFETNSTSPTSFAGNDISGYSLDQNYPNPFTGRTTISFSVPEAGFVKLDFLTIEGKLIDSFSGQYPAGKHSAEIELGSRLQPGIYLYRMETDKFVQTRLCIVR